MDPCGEQKALSSPRIGPLEHPEPPPVLLLGDTQQPEMLFAELVREKEKDRRFVLMLKQHITEQSNSILALKEEIAALGAELAAVKANSNRNARRKSSLLETAIAARSRSGSLIDTTAGDN